MEIVMVKNKKNEKSKNLIFGYLLTAKAKKKASYPNIGIYLRGIAGSY